MTKILAGFGDPHTRSKKFYKQGFQQFLKWLDQKFPDESKPVTEFVLAGDTINKVKLLVDAPALLIQMIQMMQRKASTVYAILGNHDYGLSSYKVVSAKPLLESLGVVVIENKCEYTTKLGFSLLCAPWSPNETSATINTWLKTLDHSKVYDAFVSHWEVEKPCNFNSTDFLDIKDIQARAFYCGHIHSHKFNNKYLGSLLPNSAAENKDNDPSVIRVVATNGVKYQVTDLEIPSFYTIQTVIIKEEKNLNTLIKSDNIYYRLQVTSKAFGEAAKKLGLQIYSVEKILQDNTEESEDDLEETNEQVSDFSCYTHKELLDLYREELGMGTDIYDLCTQAIANIAS